MIFSGSIFSVNGDLIIDRNRVRGLLLICFRLLFFREVFEEMRHARFVLFWKFVFAAKIQIGAKPFFIIRPVFFWNRVL